MAVSTLNYAISASNVSTIGAPWAPTEDAEGATDGAYATSTMDTAVTDELYMFFQVVLPAGSVVTGIRAFVRCNYTGISANPRIYFFIPLAIPLDNKQMGLFGPSTVTLGSTTNAYGITAANLAAGYNLGFWCSGEDEIGETAAIDSAYLEVTYTPPTTNRRRRLARRLRNQNRAPYGMRR